MEDNLVSIITPVYNGEKYIKDCIESVLNQTYKNLEMIIINDGSADNTEKIIKNYMKENSIIKYIKLNENKGIANARNMGIKKAKGRFIAFLDCDDLYHKDKIKKQVDFMIKNNYFFTYTSYKLIDENNNDLKRVICAREMQDYKSLLKGNNIGCLTVMIDKLNINEVLFFSSNHHEDYILWLTILKNNIKAYGLNEILSYYRKTKTSISHNKIKSSIWTWKIYRKVEKLPLLKSIYFFVNYVVNGIIKNK